MAISRKLKREEKEDECMFCLMNACMQAETCSLWNLQRAKQLDNHQVSLDLLPLHIQHPSILTWPPWPGTTKLSICICCCRRFQSLCLRRRCPLNAPERECRCKANKATSSSAACSIWLFFACCLSCALIELFAHPLQFAGCTSCSNSLAIPCSNLGEI